MTLQLQYDASVSYMVVCTLSFSALPNGLELTLMWPSYFPPFIIFIHIACRCLGAILMVSTSVQLEICEFHDKQEVYVSHLFNMSFLIFSAIQK